MNILFSNYAIAFYIVAIAVEYTIKYSLSSNPRRTALLKYADVAGLCAFGFLVYYSIQTVWWAFIALLLTNVILFVCINLFVKKLMPSKSAEAGTTANIAGYTATNVKVLVTRQLVETD